MLIFVMQPFYRTLVESGAAFVQVQDQTKELIGPLDGTKKEPVNK